MWWVFLHCHFSSAENHLPSCSGKDVSAELKRIHCVIANQILEHHNTPYTMSLTSENSATVPWASSDFRENKECLRPRLKKCWVNLKKKSTLSYFHTFWSHPHKSRYLHVWFSHQCVDVKSSWKQIKESGNNKKKSSPLRHFVLTPHYEETNTKQMFCRLHMWKLEFSNQNTLEYTGGN